MKLRRHLISFVTVVFTAITASAQECSLDGKWLFRHAKDAKTADSLVASRFYMPAFKADDFQSIPVPSCWAILGYEEPVYRTFADNKGSEGLYIRHFNIPSAWKGKQLRLNFGGVWASAEIWLNGKWVGRHDSGYTSFAYNVTEEALTGQDNVLAVRVRQVYKGYECDTYDDWSLGGIYRPVSITAMPAEQWIDDVRTHTTFSDNYKKAAVNVKVMMGDGHTATLPGNYRSPGNPYNLNVTLKDAQGNKVAEWQKTIPGHVATFRLVDTTLEVDNPELWNAEHPYLYTLSTELVEDGNVTHTVTKKIGLRKITTTGGVFKINGVAVKLRGVNRHDEWPDVGRATTHEHWLKDLIMMKQANVNFVRACHYQHAKGFIEMCDSIGMYVGGEISLGGAEGLMRDPGFYPGMSARIIETVTRDLDNPSVIYWSVGNEDEFNTMFYMAAKMTKALDNTRPVLYPWNADKTLPEDIDILAPHYWTAQEYASLAANSTRPIITTEYVHAYGTERFGGLDECWNALTKHPAGAGGAVWMWADQGVLTPVKKTISKFASKYDDAYLRIDASGWDGVTDSYRRPTRDYWEMKAVYAPVKIVQTQVTPVSGKAVVTLHNGYDFTGLDRFRQCWKLMVDGRVLEKGESVVKAAPQSDGSLSVPIGKLRKLREGQTAYILVNTVDTAGAEIACSTVRLNIQPEKEKTSGRVIVNETQGEVEVKSGSAIYRFSRKTGSLASVTKNGVVLFNNLRPTVWHKLNDGDYVIKNRRSLEGINLEAFTEKVLLMKVKKEGDKATVLTKVAYEINDSNQITADYVFAVLPGGKLNVDYALTTDIQTDLLPLVGLGIDLPAKNCLTRWFGAGPADAWPNKRAYTCLGLYSGRESYGCKAVDWIEMDNKKQNMRIDVNGYLVRDSDNGCFLRLTSSVLGRSEKGRLKNPLYRLSSKDTYKGSLSMK